MVNKVNNCSFSGMFLAETGLKDGKDSVIIKEGQ